jgi:geranylgeranyl diphosphate synthase type I
MALKQFFIAMLPLVEAELQRMVDRAYTPRMEEMQHMLAYHMGWEGPGSGPEARGKRIRPMLLLLSALAAGGDWERALPGAAAVELVHNFSLVHDDIQDESPTRRGRPTVWARWGLAQAINVGDALFSLAQMSVLNLSQTVSAEAGLEASHALQEASLRLTQGQYLDLSYVQRQDLSVEDYWPMVKDKTGALLSTSTYIGAVAAEASPEICDQYCFFGELLGLAFQVQDDLLGIWGDAALTGKSTESDLISGKKSLPVLYGLDQNGRFAVRWRKGSIKPNEVQELAVILEQEGGRAFVRQEADRLTKQALAALVDAQPQGEAGEALYELADFLLKRQM